VEAVIAEAITPEGRDLRASILLGGAVLRGQARRDFLPGHVFQGGEMFVETSRRVEVVTEDAFIEAGISSLPFAAIPQTRPEMRIVDFYSEEGVPLRGVVVQKCTLPASVVRHDVTLRFCRYQRSQMQVLGPDQLVNGEHLENQLAFTCSKAVKRRSAALHHANANQVLSWAEWDARMMMEKRKLDKQAEEKKAAAGFPTASVPQRRIITSSVNDMADRACEPPLLRAKQANKKGASTGAKALSKPGPALSPPARRGNDAGAGSTSAQRSRSNVPARTQGERSVATPPSASAAIPAGDVVRSTSAGGQPKTTAESRGGAGYSAKEITPDVIRECQLGVNWNRTINPVPQPVV
jgi:hypothetical protein